MDQSRWLQSELLEQLPVPQPEAFAERCPWSHGQVVSDRVEPGVLELTHTAWDMKPFAESLANRNDPGLTSRVLDAYDALAKSSARASPSARPSTRRPARG